MRPIAVVGSLARDVVDDLPPRAGGAPFYCAQALRVLDRPARIVTKCAREDRALLLRPLVLLGLPVEWRRAERTTVFTHRYEGERRFSSIEQVGDPWTPEDVRGWVAEALRRVGWVHAGALLRSDFPPETLAELGRGRRLSFEGQGLVRVSETGPLRQEPDYDPESLRHVSLLKLSEEEARVLVGEPEEEGALEQLGVPEIVVTLGSRGAIVLTGGRLERVPGQIAHGVRDPTGAGDAFAVFYLAGRNGGLAPAPAARRASGLVAGLLSTRG